jgi:hypothetical protein
MLNTLKLYDMLKAASISDEQAHAIAGAIQEAAAEISADLKGMIRQEFDLFSKAFLTKADFEARWAQIDARFAQIDTRFAQADTRIAQAESRLVRWMFVFWIGQMAVTFGLVLGVAKLLK